MAPTQNSRWNLAFRQIVEAGILNGTLATIISAAAVALWSGAGTGETFVLDVANGRVSSTLSRIPNPLEVAKAAILITPIAAVSCGTFGFLAGLGGAALLHMRRRQIRTRRRFYTEAGIAGFLLGLAFPSFDALMNRGHGTIPLTLTAPVFGVACALLTALSLGKRFQPRM